MHRPIDPKVDCVFKTLFGSDDHRDLLIRFLKVGASLDPTRLPAWMQPPIARSAMSTIRFRLLGVRPTRDPGYPCRGMSATRAIG
ncbi:hypothetical protein [Thiocapsa bogorovii]|uniref:hypothetical protein n=1 Tax=Thiocapsa bogorovii TaxID=521689 RepID=UPI0022B6BC48|nr:hypothetical protein [Thiocapsa bogorovii]